jgi:hypothetical protein
MKEGKIGKEVGVVGGERLCFDAWCFVHVHTSVHFLVNTIPSSMLM